MKQPFAIMRMSIKKEIKLKFMKSRIIFFLFIIFLPYILTAQPSQGNGTSGDPYRGTLTSNWTFTGGSNNYFGTLEVTAGIFSISSGATLKFGTGDVLIISGTGSISATGTSNSYITFTSSGTSWGHIWFNSPSESNSSIFEYCIIENGDVHNYTDYRGYGGAIHANFSNLTISNCILRNNYAQWGGAVFVNKYKNIIIENCSIYNNRSSRAGGGIYCWDYSATIIENCIFESNDCLELTTEYYSGGGLCAQTGAPVKVINCTFVNNTTTRTSGAGIELYISGGARIINSIFWGSDNQISLWSTSGNVIINSAVQSSVPSGSVNCIVLNSDNNNAAGPNFTATDGSDWSIKFVSPCRDAGVNSYSGVTIPQFDCNGNSRIHTTDIGAYEVQYSRWRTTPSDIYNWSTAGNWEQGIYPGYPNGTGDVFIPSLSSSIYAPDVSSVTIPSGKYMVMDAGAKATIGTIINNGTLRLKANSQTMASLIVDSYSGNDAEVELYLTGGPVSDSYRWHFISSPFTSLDTSFFWAENSKNLAQWVESYNRSSLSEGWFAADGWFYPSGPITTTRFNNLMSGKGYLFYYKNDTTFLIKGNFNTSDKNMTLGFTNENFPSLYGHNLLGNPFPSGLDWDVITGDNNYPSNTSKVLHILQDGVYVTYINGAGTEQGATGIIPPMQGFFTKTYAADKSISLPLSARVNDEIPQRYKGSANVPLIRIKLTTGEYYDNAVVRFDNLAKPGLDFDYDAEKFMFSNTRPYIWSVSEGVKFAINGLPFPETSAEIPLVVRLARTGTHKLSNAGLQGLENYNVHLKDNLSGFQADLKTIPEIVFTSDAGTINNRFVLLISNLSTNAETLSNNDGHLNIYYANEYLNILPLSDKWNRKSASVKVYDLTGRILKIIPSAEIEKNNILQIPFKADKGVYIVEVKSGLLNNVVKMLIR